MNDGHLFSSPLSLFRSLWHRNYLWAHKWNMNGNKHVKADTKHEECHEYHTTALASKKVRRKTFLIEFECDMQTKRRQPEKMRILWEKCYGRRESSIRRRSKQICQYTWHTDSCECTKLVPPISHLDRNVCGSVSVLFSFHLFSMPCQVVQRFRLKNWTRKQEQMKRDKLIRAALLSN